MLAARPKQGKTSLGSAITTNAAKKGHKVAFFSMEMSREELVARMLTVQSGIDALTLQRGLFTDEEEGRLLEAGDKVDALPIYIDEAAALSLANLIARGTRADAISILPHIHVAPDEACKEPPHAEYFSKTLRLLHRPRGELKGYAEAVIAAHEGRTLTGLFYKYQEAAANGEAGVLEGFMADATALHTGKPAETYRLIKGDAMTAIDKFLERKERAPGAITGISTGFPHLDHLLDGLCPKRLYVLAARPKQGKTSLGSAITTNAAKKGHKVAFFSMEMSREELVARMLTVQSGIDALTLQRGLFTDEEEGRLLEAGDKVDALPIYIDEAAALSLAALRARCRRAVKKDGCTLIVVDYLQLLRGTGRKGETRYEIVTEASMALKQIARTLEVPVIALSQLSRASTERVAKDLKNFKPEMTRPHDSDLRESGQIEQDADAVIFINRPIVILDKLKPTDGDTLEWATICNTWRKKAEVIVYFNRNGETGTVEFLFEGNTSRWKEDPSQTYFSASMRIAPLNFAPRSAKGGGNG